MSPIGKAMSSLISSAVCPVASKADAIAPPLVPANLLHFCKMPSSSSTWDKKNRFSYRNCKEINFHRFSMARYITRYFTRAMQYSHILLVFNLHNQLCNSYDYPCTCAVSITFYHCALCKVFSFQWIVYRCVSVNSLNNGRCFPTEYCRAIMFVTKELCEVYVKKWCICIICRAGKTQNSHICV